jgi:uncharacterized protein
VKPVVEKVELLTHATGEVQNLELFKWKGTDPEIDSVYIQSSVHGGELQGNYVIFELMNYFEKNPPLGSVTLLPLANPMAINQKSGAYTMGRFNVSTGDNWNRSYTDISSSKEFDIKDFVERHKKDDWNQAKSLFKEKLGKEIQNLISKLNRTHELSHQKKLGLLHQLFASSADIVLDLHTGPVACEYLYSHVLQEEKFEDLSYPFNILIPAEFDGAMEEAVFMPWVNLSQKGNFPLDFETYTLELGSEEMASQKLAKSQTNTILNFLIKRGVIKSDSSLETKAPSHQYNFLLDNFKTYYSPTGGVIEYLFSPGDYVEKGQNLARIINFKSKEKKETFLQALKNCWIINHSTLGSVCSGTEIFTVGELPIKKS